MFTIDTFPVYAPRILPKAEPFVSCRRSCKGCGKAIAARIAAKAISSEPFSHALLSSANHSLSSHAYSHNSIETINILEEYFRLTDTINRAASDKSKSGHKAIQKPVIGISRHIIKSDYLALAGLLQSSRSALYLCFDNESYIDEFINTAGVQAFTVNDTRHPTSQSEIDEMISEKNLPGDLMNENFSYCATACTSFLFDFIEKIKKGIACEGNAFILVLTPCPTGWGFSPKFAHTMGAYAVQTGYFPLYEISNNKYTVSQQLAQRKPVQQFLTMQKRFSTFPAPLLPSLQTAIDGFCNGLLKKTLGKT